MTTCPYCLSGKHIYDRWCEGCQERYKARTEFVAKLARARIKRPT